MSDRFRTLLFGLTEGVLIAALVVNVRDGLQERKFFRELAAKAVDGVRTTEDQVLALLHAAHKLVKPLQEGMEDGTVEDISGLAHYRRVLFNSVATEVLYPNGRCASYSGVLVELLKARGFPVRFAQMLDREDVNTGVAHHIIVEVWLDGRWVVCDPMYDLVFRGDDGRLLGFDEVKRDWDRLRAQCPPNYEMRYDFAALRVTNFGKLNPWLQKTPLAKFSVRTWLIEGTWIRSALVATLLAGVIAIQAWYDSGARFRPRRGTVLATSVARDPGVTTGGARAS